MVICPAVCCRSFLVHNAGKPPFGGRLSWSWLLGCGGRTPPRVAASGSLQLDPAVPPAGEVTQFHLLPRPAAPGLQHRQLVPALGNMLPPQTRIQGPEHYKLPSASPAKNFAGWTTASGTSSMPDQPSDLGQSCQPNKCPLQAGFAHNLSGKIPFAQELDCSQWNSSLARHDASLSERGSGQ
jgi:hypothetical protein